MDVTIVTYGGMAKGAPDDHLLARALEADGANVRYAVWDDPGISWAATPVSIVRSVWDYHHSIADWYSWLERVELLTTLVNPGALLRWNSDKSYLLALEDSGVPIVPTMLLSPGESADVEARLAARGWTDIVIKPAVGASSSGAGRFTANEIASQGLHHLDRLLAKGSVLVQPYQVAVDTLRERSLVFIKGACTHAFTKPPFHAGLDGAGSALREHEPLGEEIDLALAALNSLSHDPVFARVDMLPTRNGPVLMELELIEPQLAFGLCPEAAERLAAAIIADRSTHLRRHHLIDFGFRAIAAPAQFKRQ